MAAGFRLVSPLDSQQKEHAKRVSDGIGQSFGSWPWHKKLLFSHFSHFLMKEDLTKY